MYVYVAVLVKVQFPMCESMNDWNMYVLTSLRRKEIKVHDYSFPISSLSTIPPPQRLG